MKKFVLLIVTSLFVYINSQAQFPMTESALENYLKNNIHILQPFEGLYSVKSTNNVFIGITTNFYKRAIVYSDGTYKIATLRDDGLYVKYGEYFYNTNTNSFILKSTGKTYHNINNPNYFIMNTDYGGGSYEREEYTKYFPNPEMYAEANWENKVQEASNLIQNGFFSSALAILDDVMKKHKGPREYYYRASAYYGLKKFYAAIQDCNFALSYNNSEQNNSMIYYLRGLCRFLTDDKESGIADMEKAGEDGAKFLEEEGYTKTSAGSQKSPNSNKAKNNKTPILKKTK